MTDTFDNKRVIKPLTLTDIDRAMLKWWDEKLSIHLTVDDGSKRKVPVLFVAQERWSLAREEGIRDENGTIVLPIIAISRTKVGGPNEGYLGRIIADTKQPHPEALASLTGASRDSRINELLEAHGREARASGCGNEGAQPSTFAHL